jgi:hypothetical protein
MWKSVCQKCGWSSGEAYLQSVAEAIGRVHEEDNKGHKVMMKEVPTFGSDPEGESEPRGPASSKS